MRSPGRIARMSALPRLGTIERRASMLLPGEPLLPAADVQGVFAGGGAMALDDVRRTLVSVAGAYRLSWAAAVGRGLL